MISLSAPLHTAVLDKEPKERTKGVCVWGGEYMTVIPAQEVEAEVPQGPQGRVSLPGIHEISALVNKPNKKFTWKGL